MNSVKLGIDNIDLYLDVFKDKRVGLITNPTGINSNFVSTIDVLYEKTNLKALYSPEHGVRGNIQAGVKMDSYIDEKTGVMVYSLYGSMRKPSKELMDDIDLICIDIQDVGSRFYTYIYTMAYCMMACKEFGKKFVVFDRPNPARCDIVEGNILDINYRSFVGYYPICQRHGLTIGEISKMFNEEFGIGCDLTIIKMSNYKRNMSYNDTNKLWVVPSPNFPKYETSYVYNATCIFEGTNISEGRGTTTPFEVVGAPFIDPYKLSERLNSYGFNNVFFRPMFFTPTFSKYKDETCGGVYVHVFDNKMENSVKIGWMMLYEIRKMYPDNFKIIAPYVEGKPCMLQYNTGCNYIFEDKYNINELFDIIDKDTLEFTKTRKKYLLY